MSPSKRIGLILRKQASLEERVVAEQLKLLASMRKALISALVDATGYRYFHLTQILTAIDRETARLRTGSQATLSQATQDAYQLGVGMVDAATGDASLYGVSGSLLSAAIEVTNDQVRAVWSELGSALKSAVRRVTLGITDPYDAMKQVAKLIRDPKTFGRAETRAEVIIRTEVNRTFSIASQKRMEQSNVALGGGLKKWWLTAEDSRVRPNHAAAGERYSKDKPIDVDERFVVGGDELMFPRDPRGSAGETINCRCVSVPYVDDVAAAADDLAASA